MAIKKIFKSTEDGNYYKSEFPDSYWKIDMLNIDPVRKMIRIGVRGYLNETSRREQAMGIYKKVYDITFDDIKPTDYSYDAILTATYEYLKTLPEFEEGEDV